MYLLGDFGESYLTSLSLRFLICKMRIALVSTCGIIKRYSVFVLGSWHKVPKAFNFLSDNGDRNIFCCFSETASGWELVTRKNSLD